MAVTPLHLMLGRATAEAPRIRLEEPVTTEHRLRFLEELRQSFWNKWQAVIFQGLDRSAKWRHEQQDFRKGDVVLLKSETAAAATYRIALIDCAYPSLSDNKVRKVHVKYKNQEEGGFRFSERPSDKIVLVVPYEEQQYDSEIFKGVQSRQESEPEATEAGSRPM